MNHQQKKMEDKKFLEKVALQLSSSDVAGNLIYQHPLHHSLPNREKLKYAVELIRKCLFPGYFSESPKYISWKSIIENYLEQAYLLLSEQIYAGLCLSCEALDIPKCLHCKDKAMEICQKFFQQLHTVQSQLSTDVEAIYNGDPAAKTHSEVIICYPGILAITNYRIAHELYKLGVPIIPRMITEFAHSETGIDIHPGADIGKHFAIDHGTGIVIGETSIIGDHVKIYQGVTLGAKSFPLDENGNPIKGIPRHPIVEDHVVIYAEATILGRVTIGHHSVIGANQWITEDIPPYTKMRLNC